MEKLSQQEAEARVNEILTRGVGEFIDPDNVFRKKLLGRATGTYTKDIVVKFGVDPTRPDIHLGHAVVLHKLRQMQDLGCRIIFLIGDVTALIGDPSGKSTVRPEMEYAEIMKNLLTYTTQVDKILHVRREGEKIVHDEKFSWIKNSEWFLGVTDITVDPNAKFAIEGKPQDPNSFLGKAWHYEKSRMQLSELGKKHVVGYTLFNALALLRGITHSQLIERDMFQDRLRSGSPLYMHEMFYPVLQGIDSIMIRKIYGSCDLEVGGTDQTFNMLIGRKAMEISKENELQGVLAVKLLTGTDGKEKMSKSLDNYIGITDAPEAMFGKLMSIPDSAIVSYYELCTFTPTDEIVKIAKQLDDGDVNPRDLKMDLAEQIVAIYHGVTPAKAARGAFVATFQKRGLPTEIPETKARRGESLSDVLLRAGAAKSKTDFRRLIKEGAIRKNGEEKIADPLLEVEEAMTLKIGKYRFLKIVVE